MCIRDRSTVGGLNRSLTTGEMLEQIYEVQRITGERVSNVILMGIGEPLDNYENVVRFIRMISDERGLHISQRNITLSTCGLVDGIYRLMKEDLTITLAISLHAPNDVPVSYTHLDVYKRQDQLCCRRAGGNDSDQCDHRSPGDRTGGIGAGFLAVKNAGGRQSSENIHVLFGA